MGSTNFIASIADIKHYRDMPEEFLPYVHLKAALESRTPEKDDKIAILNISTTTSYLAVFLDNGKTIEQLEDEVNESWATLNLDSQKVLKHLLEASK